MKIFIFQHSGGEQKFSIGVKEISKENPDDMTVPTHTFSVPKNFIWELPNGFIKGTKKPTHVTNLGANGYLKTLPKMDPTFKKAVGVCPNIGYETAKGAIPANNIWVILTKSGYKPDLLIVLTEPESVASFFEHSYQYQEERMWHWYYTKPENFKDLIAYIFKALIDEGLMEKHSLFDFSTKTSLSSHKTSPLVSYQVEVSNVCKAPPPIAEIIIDYMCPQPQPVHVISKPVLVQCDSTFFNTKEVIILDKPINKEKESLHKELVSNNYASFVKKLNGNPAQITRLLENTLAAINATRSQRTKNALEKKFKNFVEDYAAQNPKFWQMEGVVQIANILEIGIPNAKPKTLTFSS